jgi:hypothetical protein
MHGAVVAIGAFASMATSQRRTGWLVRGPITEMKGVQLRGDGETRTNLEFVLSAPGMSKKHPPIRSTIQINGSAAWHGDGEGPELVVSLPYARDPRDPTAIRIVLPPNRPQNFLITTTTVLEGCVPERECRRTVPVGIAWTGAGDDPIELEWTTYVEVLGDARRRVSPPEGTTVTLEVVP